jgi:hypothetical protein
MVRGLSDPSFHAQRTRALEVSERFTRLLWLAYRFRKFDDLPPLSAENIVDKVYQLLVLAPSLRIAETKNLVRRTTLSHTRNSQIGQTTLHTVEQGDTETLEVRTGRLCSLLTPVAVTCGLLVRRRSHAARHERTLTEHHSSSATADANRLSVYTPVEKCLLVKILDGLEDLTTLDDLLGWTTCSRSYG